MALFIRQDDERSELQKRLAAELQHKSKLNSEHADRPDGVEDSQYIKGLKTTTSLSGFWVILIILVVGIIIWLTVVSMSR